MEVSRDKFSAQIILNSCLILLCISVGACGVRGDPLAPLTPAEIGRGQPTYEEATDDLTLPDVPPEDETIDRNK